MQKRGKLAFTAACFIGAIHSIGDVLSWLQNLIFLHSMPAPPIADFAIVAAMGFFVWIFWREQQPTSKTYTSPSSPTSAIIPSNAASDPASVKNLNLRRRHRTVTLSLGELCRLPSFSPFDETIELELKDIREESRPDDLGASLGSPRLEPCAQVHVNLGGSLVHGGPEAKQTNVNEYKLFKPIGNEIDAAMAFSAMIRESSFTFCGVYAVHINVHSRTAELAVVVIRL